MPYSKIINIQSKLVNINYEFVIWTNFISQMNGLVEAFTEFNNQYWGEGQERKFFSLIENISYAWCAAN